MNSLVAGKLVSLQFAADGAWEKAIAFPDHNLKRSNLEIWLDQAPSDVAIEVFVADDWQPNQFLGIRLASLPMQNQKLFCMDCFDFFFNSLKTADDFINFVRSKLQISKLFDEPTDFLELGMVNNWQPFGPVRFWPNTSSDNVQNAFEQTLKTNPHYVENTVKPIAIEFAYLSPLPHWRGMIVSDFDGNSYRLNSTKAYRILNEK